MAYVPNNYVSNNIDISYSSMASTGYRNAIPSGRHIVMNTTLPTASVDGFVKQQAANLRSSRYEATVREAERDHRNVMPFFSREGVRFSLALSLLAVLILFLLSIFTVQLMDVRRSERNNDLLRSSVNGYTQEYNDLEARYTEAKDQQLRDLAEQALNLGMTKTTKTTAVTLSANPAAQCEPTNLYP